MSVGLFLRSPILVWHVVDFGPINTNLVPFHSFNQPTRHVRYCSYSVSKSLW